MNIFGYESTVWPFKLQGSVFNTSKSETATFGAKTRQKPPQFFSLKTATILAQTATILEISDFFP